VQPIEPRILSVAASGRWPGFAWLDGGPAARGWLGLEPDLEIEADALDLLDEVDRRWRADRSRVWIGWLTYDLGAASLLARPPVRGRVPGLCLRRYPAALELRPGASPRAHGHAHALERLREALAHAPAWASDPAWPLTALTPTIGADEYRARVARAQDHIRAGDTYQVNLSQRMHARWRRPPRSIAGAAAGIFARLRADTPADMGALVAVGGSWLISNSPETLVDVHTGSDGDLARSWPIKGTRPRGVDAASDAAAANELRASVKDLAEHVMILDLVRNDLGRLAVPGTVQAPAEPDLVSLPTVHHLVSCVQARLRPGWSLRALVDALFPGGSVTGAPKRRTVEIIDTLEREPREIYCGALMVLEPEGLRMSIPIRTGILDREGLRLRSGGGIVVDSDAEDERQETLAKARAFDPERVR
jgi:anthranilate/para-aminobenzoate synthase component I